MDNRPDTPYARWASTYKEDNKRGGVRLSYVKSYVKSDENHGGEIKPVVRR